MSIFYVDASAWVKYYVEEAGSDWMEQFWERRFVCQF
jgi:predicted nucleic acid-binding protein